MKYLPILIFAVVILGLFVLMGRARRKQAAGQLAQAERIGVGDEVMTTAGLYGTVVAKNDDGTATLAIAPGVEVRWEIAALRDLASLPPRPDGVPRPGASPYDPPPTAEPPPRP